MSTVNPYLNFNGNCEEAFNLYKSVFGGEFAVIMRHKDIPSNIGHAKEDADKVSHIALPIGKGTILMGSDIPSTFPKANVGTNFFVSVDTDTEDDAVKIFNKLSSGGKVYMPLDKTFWGAFYGMLVDKYGIQWMVSYTEAQQAQPAEEASATSKK